MLDSDFVKRKIGLIQDELMRLGEFANLTIDEIAKDYRTQAIVERLLERIIGRAVDINQHLIAECGAHLETVRKYRDTFLRLADLEVYPHEFATQIAPSVGLRNALVHDYNDIDREVLQKSIGEAIAEFNDYTKYILAFLEKG
ncbi:MAG: hypothetical protein G01um101433_491 [Parcubacteria group bacterium Gr01-1014_33]|nr:MAG: hypothetical protein G01um101433_491 [Parcubacteria group bacterium Gr01-1014_33]